MVKGEVSALVAKVNVMPVPAVAFGRPMDGPGEDRLAVLLLLLLLLLLPTVSVPVALAARLQQEPAEVSAMARMRAEETLAVAKQP